MTPKQVSPLKRKNYQSDQIIFICTFQDFAIDLYPFYPPLVKVIRPRLQASLMQRVTNMEMLKLSYWNPREGHDERSGRHQEVFGAMGKVSDHHLLHMITVWFL